MGRRGEITLFLAMVLVCISALLCTIVESARTAGARCLLRTAVDASADSLMAQYHRTLWEKYRLFGLEYRDEVMLEKEFEQFLKPYLEAENWYPMKAEAVRMGQVMNLTDGACLEQEILDYMKYGLVGVLWDALDEGTAGEMLDNLKEAGSVNEVSDCYSGHTKEAVRLEKALEEIGKCLDGQQADWQAAADAAGEMDGSGFISHVNGVIGHMRRIPGLVSTYEKRADALDRKLKESRREFEGKTDVSDSVRAALEDEIRQYEAYTDMDGVRRREIQGLTERSRENISFCQETIELAEEVMEIIADQDEDEEDEVDEEELWESVADFWASYPMLRLGIQFGVRDKEKQKNLEWIRDLKDEGILALVLPAGAEVSAKSLDLRGAPSKEMGERSEVGETAPNNAPAGVTNLFERLLVCEYGIRFFERFEKNGSSEAFYEMEYILNGKEKDKANLTATAETLLALREGLNLVHILSDTGKREEARALAIAIVGGTGILPLVSIMTFFIMTVWAFGEALLDVRSLFDGGKVPLIKGKGDWKLSLEGLLALGKDKSMEGLGVKSEEKGLDYRGYLRLLYFWKYGKETAGRMMDVIQNNVRGKQPGFCLEQCACQVDMEVEIGGKHVFFSPALWKSQMGDRDFSYSTVMEVSGTYFAD